MGGGEFIFFINGFFNETESNHTTKYIILLYYIKEIIRPSVLATGR